MPLYRINPFVKDFTKELYHLQDKRLLGGDDTDIAMRASRPTPRPTLINQNGNGCWRPRGKRRSTNRQSIREPGHNVGREIVVKQPGPGTLPREPGREFVATERMANWWVNC
jgi:hypothetical protein